MLPDSIDDLLIHSNMDNSVYEKRQDFMLSKVTIHGRFLKKAKIVVLAHKISALFQKSTVKAVLNNISKT